MGLPQNRNPKVAVRLSMGEYQLSLSVNINQLCGYSVFLSSLLFLLLSGKAVPIKVFGHQYVGIEPLREPVSFKFSFEFIRDFLRL